MGLHFQVHGWRKSGQQLKQEAKEKPRRDAADWLAPSSQSSQLSHIVQVHLLGDGITYSGLSLSVSKGNHKKRLPPPVPQASLLGAMFWLRFLPLR